MPGKKIFMLGSAFALAACGGGGGIQFNPIDLSSGPASYSDLNTAVPYLTGYKNRDPIDPASLPTSEIHYYGVILMGTDLSILDDPAPTRTGYVGRVDLTIDFDANTIDGVTDSFYETELDRFGDPNGTMLADMGNQSVTLNVASWTDSEFVLNVTGTFDGSGVSGTLDQGKFTKTQAPGGTVGVYARSGDLSPITIGSTDFDAVLAAD